MDELRAETLFVWGRQDPHVPFAGRKAIRARLEEVAGNLVAARRIVALGCDSAPQNEDVWLEAARLETPETAKKICTPYCPFHSSEDTS